jgi:hypothetical protein
VVHTSLFGRRGDYAVNRTHTLAKPGHVCATQAVAMI